MQSFPCLGDTLQHVQADKYPHVPSSLVLSPRPTSPVPYRKINMPDLTIINNLDETIHVAFFIVAPANWKNNLLPGERWTTHLPTLPLHFQARWAERTDGDSGTVYRSREFCPEESWEMGATIGAAYAAGTASVITAVIAGGPIVAGPLMMAAHAGENSLECLAKIRILINV